MMNSIEKRTVVVGATPNQSRYAYIAADMLHDDQVPFIPLGIKQGEVLGEAILDIKKRPEIKDVHTLTLYVGAQNLAPYHDYLLSLHPQRIIFNPGAENPDLYAQAKAAGVDVVEACTLVMIRSNQF